MTSEELRNRWDYHSDKLENLGFQPREIADLLGAIQNPDCIDKESLKTLIIQKNKIIDALEIRLRDIRKTITEYEYFLAEQVNRIETGG